MAQFFSPASTFLVKNTPEIDPMEAWGKCTRPMGRRLFSWMKQSAQFIPLYSPILYSPYGACTVIGNSWKFESFPIPEDVHVLFLKNSSSGGPYPFFVHKKKKSPNITTPEPPKKKTTPRKKHWNQPSKSTTSTSTNSWRVAHQSDALRFDSHGWIVQYSTGVASGGLASNKYSPPKQRTEKWPTLPGVPPRPKKRMKNWMVKTHVDLKHLKDAPLQISQYYEKKQI